MPKQIWTPELKKFIENEFIANRIGLTDSPASVRNKYADKFGHFKPGTFSRVYAELKHDHAKNGGGSKCDSIIFM